MTLVSHVKDSVRACRACSLHTVGHGPVPFSGPAPNFLAVVGEAPGRQEDERGEPFVGPAGQMLRDCMEYAGINSSSTTFINAVSCFPDRTPTSPEINACSTNLLAQLQIVNPLWVILLGNVALSTQRPDLKITKARGKVLEHAGSRWRFFVTYHPSYAMRQRQAEAVLKADLSTLVEIMDGQDWATLTDDSCVSCGDDVEVIASQGRWLRFDDWQAPYCSECFEKAPMNVQAEKERVKVDKVQEKTGQLF